MSEVLFSLHFFGFWFSTVSLGCWDITLRNRVMCNEKNHSYRNNMAFP